MNDGDLLKIVNPSGFAFQLAVDEVVRFTQYRHGWDVTSREHGWKDGSTPRFIDLVLTKRHIHLVIECKKTRGADWVFLVPNPLNGPRANQERRFRTHHLRTENGPAGQGRHAVGSLAEFHTDRQSWQSSFCTVRGSGETDPPMLDRICAELTRSTDAISKQQLAIDGSENSHGRIELRDRSWIIVPVIVTTAKLTVCVFDPAGVPLETGELVVSSNSIGVFVWEHASSCPWVNGHDRPPSGANRRSAPRSTRP